jgi:hypothetical protein
MCKINALKYGTPFIVLTTAMEKNKALQNWKIFINSYQNKLSYCKGYNETIMMIAITKFSS